MSQSTDSVKQPNSSPEDTAQENMTTEQDSKKKIFRQGMDECFLLRFVDNLVDKSKNIPKVYLFFIKENQL